MDTQRMYIAFSTASYGRFFATVELDLDHDSNKNFDSNHDPNYVQLQF